MLKNVRRGVEDLRRVIRDVMPMVQDRWSDTLAKRRLDDDGSRLLTALPSASYIGGYALTAYDSIGGIGLADNGHSLAGVIACATVFGISSFGAITDAYRLTDGSGQQHA